MKQFFGLIIAVLAFTCAYAEAEPKSEEDTIEFIRKSLSESFPMPVESVKATPIKGLYEVIAAGQIGYFSADMKYVIAGDILDYGTNTNITDIKRSEIRSELMNKMGKDNYIAFAPKGDSKYVMNVFTDVDCGYCRKLHQEVPSLNEKGVEVRYFLYPRSGENTPSAQKLENAWCAKDQQKALTAVKQGKKIKDKSCNNPIQTHLALGARMGLTGTPLIITEKGTRINGYRPADQLFTVLVGESIK